MRLDEVGQPLELGVPRCGERNAGGHERLAGAPADLGEERGPEPVLLEQAVEARAQHTRLGIDRAVVLAGVAVVEADPARCAGASRNAPVPDLVAGDALAHRLAAPLPGELGRLEGRVDVEPAEPGDL